MSLEKGNEEDLKKNETPVSLEEMKIQFELMQREIAALRNQGAPQQAGLANVAPGMNPEQFKMLIAEVVKAAKEQPENQNRLTVQTFVEERDIDPTDFDSKGVLFCAYSTGYLIVDDVRQGFPVGTPYGNAIFFLFNGQTITRDSDGNQVLNTFCTYLSKSKKEQEWLKNHRYFGIKFFESAKEALSTDAVRAQKLMKYVDSLMSQDAPSIVTQCRQYEVPISEDMRTMRILLANRMLDAVEGQKESVTSKILAQKLEEELFMNDPTKFTPERKDRTIR